MPHHAEIAGAGFAGLTLGIALCERGWTVRIHEQSSQLRSVGAGIFCWDNGIEVIDALGALNFLEGKTFAASTWDERDEHNNVLASRPFPMPGDGRMITLTRKDLHQALTSRAQACGVDIRTSSCAMSATADGRLKCADGESYQADLVVAADGINSAVRDSLGLKLEKTEYAIGVFRLLVSRSREETQSSKWASYVNFWNFTDNRRVLYVPCNDRELYLLLGASTNDTEALQQPFDVDPWLRSFPILRSPLSRIDVEPHFNVYVSLKLKRWSDGRVVILGDAAHGMPPTIGQGAGVAMANAYALAQCVSDTADLSTALRLWEAQNRPPTELTQDISIKQIGNLFREDFARKQDSWDSDTLRQAVPRRSK